MVVTMRNIGDTSLEQSGSNPDFTLRAERGFAS
jgi:hypothetical protein